MRYILYGIPACDTVRKVRKHLDDHQMIYDFVDFKKQPPTPAEILRWREFMKAWPVNTKGPTYRKIQVAFESADDEEKIKLLIGNSSAIKRPILELDSVTQAIGFDRVRLERIKSHIV